MAVHNAARTRLLKVGMLHYGAHVEMGVVFHLDHRGTAKPI